MSRFSVGQNLPLVLATKFHVSLHFRFYNNGQRLFGSGIICDQKRQNQNAVFRENANLFLSNN